MDLKNFVAEKLAPAKFVPVVQDKNITVRLAGEFVEMLETVALVIGSTPTKLAQELLTKLLPEVKAELDAATEANKQAQAQAALKELPAGVEVVEFIGGGNGDVGTPEPVKKTK